MRKVSAAVLAAMLATTTTGAHGAPTSQAHWIAGYTLPAFLPEDTRAAGFEHDYAGHTIRETMRLNTAGSRLRIKFTNETGAAPVAIGRARIALAGPDGEPVPGSEHEIAFGGKPGRTLAAGAAAYGDPVDLSVPAFGDVVVSIFIPGPAPVHLGGHLAAIRIADGDVAAAPHLDGVAVRAAPSFVSRIDVETRRPQHVLVAVGDSITEGAGSTPGAHMSWPDQFAHRLAASPYGHGWVVANASISGNRVLRPGSGPDLLHRFDRDVLDTPGVSAVILLEGVNDIGRASTPAGGGQPVAAADLIGAYKQIIARSHARGLRIYGCTILPYGGAKYYTAEGDATRRAVNAWIRASRAFDGVIDFDAVARDPADPARLSKAVDSGDHLHPSNGGYTLMAAAVDPALIAAGPPLAHTSSHTELP